MITRRSFVKAGLLGSLISPKDILRISDIKNSRIGIQLYSVRDDMTRDPEETLKKLSEIGFKNVEHANYSNDKFYGFEPKDFASLLKNYNLKMPSGHVSFGLNDWNVSSMDFTDEWKSTVENAKIVGQEFLITPWMDEDIRKNYDSLMRLLELFNKCGELCKKYALKFGYHNHDFEFNSHLKNKRLFDLIIENIDPELVTLQLDVGNMFSGRGKALDELKRYPGRFSLIHIKDEITSENGEMGGNYESTILGEGILPVKDIIQISEENNSVAYYIIEQESYQNRSPLSSMERNLQYMNKFDL